MRSTGLRRAAVTVSLVLAIGGLVGCGDDDSDVDAGGSSSVVTSASPTPAPVENAVAITGVDYGYTLDKPAVDSGLTKIEFINGGKDAHMLVISQITPGKTFKDAQAALVTQDEKDDEGIFVETDDYPAGAPQILTPGARTTTYTDLKSGSYALICFFPTPDGKAHFAAGMLAEFTVNAAATTAPAPVTTAEATVVEGTITIPDLSSGKAMLKVTNAGKSAHDFTVVSTPPGKTFADILAVVDKYFQGQGKVADIAGVFHGGLTSLPAGTSGVLELDLPPGTYYVICTEGEGDGKEHFRVGTEKVEFKVA